MSNNLMQKVLLVGTGNMGKEYAKVLSALDVPYDVIGRGEKNVEEFQKCTGHIAYAGGVEKYLSNCQERYTEAIVAVQDYLECKCVEALLEHGIKKILAEKPLGLDIESLQRLQNLEKEKHAAVRVAYNRRFYASVLAAEKMIEEDGGVSSFHFEFTELSCESVERAQAWLISNSAHVMDLAFFLGGEPDQMTSYTNKIEGQREEIAFVGCGRSERGALFSYCANYRAPGRWGVEIMTPKRRLIFKPMEKLQVQKAGSFLVGEEDIDNELDILYKPGLYRQTQEFLSDNNCGRIKSLDEQIKSMEWYYKILG